MIFLKLEVSEKHCNGRSIPAGQGQKQSALYPEDMLHIISHTGKLANQWQLWRCTTTPMKKCKAEIKMHSKASKETFTTTEALVFQNLG